MTRPKLAVQPRSVRGKEVAKLRREGTLPGVLYGAGTDSTPVSIDAREFEVFRRHSGRHAVVDLHLDGGKPKPVLLQAIQEHPVTRKPLHVDFLAVNMEEERTVDVPIVIIGESEAVEKMGGVLLHLRDAVLVRAKPDDIPSGVELDVTPLVDFDHVLHASDLVVPAGATLVTDPSEAVARVQPPRVEEEPEPVEAEEAEEGAEEADGAEEGAASAEATAEGGGSEETQEES
jgi:large subunit ribosomal protein L25